MANFCYMLGDESSKTCALIDPAFEIERILEAVSAESFSVTHVINTHAHADHTAGNASIIARTGAKLLIHESESKRLVSARNRAVARILGGRGSPKADIFLGDGDVISIGESSIKVIHTPGHTEGGICLYLSGHIFTGDTLFVGAIGRTDLPGGSFRTLLKSIREKIYTLPGDTIVWPGHDYGSRPSSTVDFERRTNPYTGN
jgi:glyoxylase-like metal-dependent hydrolase (beta-lactamase superfamily II)